MPIVQAQTSLILEGKYLHFYSTSELEISKMKTKHDMIQVKKISPIIPVLQRIILFQKWEITSITHDANSNIFITSYHLDRRWRYWMIWIRIYGRSFLAIGPSGLVTILLDQPCQFRHGGGWSKRIVVAFSSESDSNTFTNEETQYHISYYSFSLTMAWIASLITHEYPWRNNLQSILVVWVYVHYFLLLAVC